VSLVRARAGRIGSSVSEKGGWPRSLSLRLGPDHRAAVTRRWLPGLLEDSIDQPVFTAVKLVAVRRIELRYQAL
jgi:hypothetical protein